MTYAPPALYATKSRDYCLGVDLGTTFVAAAICDGPRPEMVTLGGRSVVIPSAVYLDEDGRLLCGEAAAHRSVSDPTRAARGFFKRRLGDPTPLRMGEQTRSVPELLAALLGEVLRVVSEVEGVAPRQVMLTHPANWGPMRRRIFAEVAQLAGLGEVPTTTEPEAAAAYYASSRHLPDGRLMAVYDLGGGTFDATVLRAHRGGVRIVGAPEGIERLGGIDFDNALFCHLDLLCDGALSSLDANDPRAAVTLARLEQDIVLAKEHLSVDARARVPVFLPDRTVDVVLTRAEFEGLIRAHVDSTVVALQRTLGSAGVSAEELDAILLVGGSSRIPLVAHMLTEALGRPVAVDTHPKYAVALGAATLAAEMHTLVPAGRSSEVGAGADRHGGSERIRAGSPVSGAASVSGRSRALVLAGTGGSGGGAGADRPVDGWGEQWTQLMTGLSDSVASEVPPTGHGADGDRDGADAEPPALMVVAADGALRAPRRNRPRVPAKMLAAAVALLGSGAVGHWALRSEEPPVVDAAGPVQSCDGDCVSALSPPAATRPSLPEPSCSGSDGDCGDARPPAAAVPRSTAGFSGSAPSRSPLRARVAAPLSAPVSGDEDVAARRVSEDQVGATGTAGGKRETQKKSSKKGSEKKSGAKHKAGSDSSPILGGIV